MDWKRKLGHRGAALSCAFMIAGCAPASTTPDASPDAPTAGPCSPETGLVAPLPECSPSRPCQRIAAELPQVPIIEASSPPSCADPRWTAMVWTVGDSPTPRHACVFRPAGASEAARVPLVLWFHPGGEGADTAETETHLLDKAGTFDLSGDPRRPGFLLAVVQGRNLHFPTAAPRDGRHHDFYFRDLRSPSTNPDVASADALIDRLVAEQLVDPARVYVMGWSNGGFFAQLYAIARHDTATPGGTKVAAAAVFATADPFHNIDWDPFTARAWQGPASCQLDRYPRSDVPILLVYRTCDLATPCGSSDSTCFAEEPGYETSQWLAAAGARGVTGIVGYMIGGVERGAELDRDTTSCTQLPRCSAAPCSVDPTGPGCLCLVNHLRWPDGVYGNGAGVDREPGMLTFLRANPLR